MQPQKLLIKLEGQYGLDLRDIAFASQKISKIIIRAKQTLYPEFKKEKEDFFIKVDKLEEGSLIIEITLILQALYEMLQVGLTIKDVIIEVFDAIEKFKKIWDIITQGNTPEIKKENGMITISIEGNNNQVNINPQITISEPVFRTSMASEKELLSFAKQIEDDKLKSLVLDEKNVLDKTKLNTINKAVKAIKYLKNLPIKETHKAEVKIFEYNKKNKSGLLEIINTTLFKVKYSKSISFILDEKEPLETIIIKNMMEENTLIVKYEPIIYDHIEYKELKKLKIIDIEE